MREAVGGTMLMYIVIFFLIIYIFFMAVVINYGRVFRAKNGLISFIEAEEGFKSGMTESVVSKANSLGYKGKILVCWTQGNADTKYFSVQLYITFQLPLINEDVIEPVEIPITGETSGIRNVQEDNVVEIHECGTGSTKFNESTHNIR